MLGIIKPVAKAIVSSPRLFELSRIGGAEYIHPRRFATKAITKNSVDAPKNRTITAAKTFDITRSTNEIFFIKGERAGFSTKIFLFLGVFKHCSPLVRNGENRVRQALARRKTYIT